MNGQAGREGLLILDPDAESDRIAQQQHAPLAVPRGPGPLPRNPCRPTVTVRPSFPRPEKPERRAQPYRGE